MKAKKNKGFKPIGFTQIYVKWTDGSADEFGVTKNVKTVLDCLKNCSLQDFLSVKVLMVFPERTKREIKSLEIADLGYFH